MVVHAAEPPPVTADGVVLRFLGRATVTRT